jgi:hypothetical protein
MQRASTWIFVAVLVFIAVAVTPAARACIEDSTGLELIDGELPGGG